MSLFPSMIGRMFEELAQGGDLAHVDDAALIDTVAWLRVDANDVVTLSESPG